MKKMTKFNWDRALKGLEEIAEMKRKHREWAEKTPATKADVEDAVNYILENFITPTPSMPYELFPEEPPLSNN